MIQSIQARLNLTQEEIARRLGVSFSTVNGWARGRTEPRPRHRAALERLHRMTFADSERLPHIVCVDDAEVDRALFAAQIRHANAVLGWRAQVVECADPVDALVTIGRVQPTLTFIDIVMPRMDGREVVERLNQMPDVIFGELVLVTGHRSRSVDDFAHRLGLTVLSKPVNTEELGAVLRRHALGRTVEGAPAT